MSWSRAEPGRAGPSPACKATATCFYKPLLITTSVELGVFIALSVLLGRAGVHAGPRGWAGGRVGGVSGGGAAWPAVAPSGCPRPPAPREDPGPAWAQPGLQEGDDAGHRTHRDEERATREDLLSARRQGRIPYPWTWQIRPRWRAEFRHALVARTPRPGPPGLPGAALDGVSAGTLCAMIHPPRHAPAPPGPTKGRGRSA